jgi:hypothetical protein
MVARIAIMAAFDVAVSVCLAIFTTASRSQVFAVTAAYVSLSCSSFSLHYAWSAKVETSVAAVHVVFIGTNGSSTCGAVARSTNATLTAR